MHAPGGEEASYGLEDITQTTMSLVDRSQERKAVDNRIDNRKNLVDAYVCPECGQAFTTVAVHAGAVPFLADCDKMGCGGDAARRTADSRVHVDGYEGPIDYEWYRPLSQEECESTRGLIETEARSLADDPIFPEDPGRREFYVQAAIRDRAKHVLTGGLVRRPREG